MQRLPQGRGSRGCTFDLDTGLLPARHLPHLSVVRSRSHFMVDLAQKRVSCSRIAMPHRAERRMSGDEEEPSVDLSVSPEHMMRIRDGVRRLLVQHIHELRIASRAFRKAGLHDRARRCEVEAGRLTRAVATLENPMSMLRFPPEEPPKRGD